MLPRKGRTKKIGQSFFLAEDQPVDETEFILQSKIASRTGFSIDQLRKWRQRYGFPSAQIDVNGRPIYSTRAIFKLSLIKRLLEAGFRPGQIVAKSESELNLLLLNIGNATQETHRSELTAKLIEALSKLNIQNFAQLLLQDRQSKTILEFCQNTLAPLMISVGEAWAKNEIEVFHVHICTAFAERLLAAEILMLTPTEGNPTFLFALPPKEKHILGLLMAESVISETGANVCNLGAEVPLTTIKIAAQAIKADVVCVSFSFSYPSREVVPVLRRLRSLLPANVQLWAGGSGIPFLTKSIKGVVINSDLNKTVEKVAAVPHNFTH